MRMAVRSAETTTLRMAASVEDCDQPACDGQWSASQTTRAPIRPSPAASDREISQATSAVLTACAGAECNDDHHRRSVTEHSFRWRGPAGHLMTRQYARLAREWVASIGLDPLAFGTHSMRRTKATLIYRRTGNLRAVQLLLGPKQDRKHRPAPRHRGRR